MGDPSSEPVASSPSDASPADGVLRALRVHVGWQVVLGFFGAVAVGVVAQSVLHSARRSLGWFAAAVLVAILVDGPVDLLTRVMRRGLAIVVLFAALFAVVGVVVYGVFNDLSTEIDRLEVELPRAAAELEASDQFGGLARDLELRERARDAVDGLGERLSGEARSTAASFGAYFAGTVLVLFLLAWLPRFIDGGLAQIREERRRANAREVVDATLHNARRYLSSAIVVAFASGIISFVVARLVDLPAPVALGLFVAILSFIPYLGVFVGSFPMIVLAAGLQSTSRALFVLFAAVVLQVACAAVMRPVQRRTVYVGPGITLVVGLLGFAAYNVGGALVGIAAAVFALALVDALATNEEPPSTLDALVIV